VMIEVGRARRNFLTQAEIVDGTSHTAVIGECPDRAQNEGGLWISGFNCFSHDNGPINSKTATDEISSRHAGGAYVAFADGKVPFVSEHTAAFVIGALCTRNGGEPVNDY